MKETRQEALERLYQFLKHERETRFANSDFVVGLLVRMRAVEEAKGEAA